MKQYRKLLRNRMVPAVQTKNRETEPPAEMTMPEVVSLIRNQPGEFFVTIEFGGDGRTEGHKNGRQE